MYVNVQMVNEGPGRKTVAFIYDLLARERRPLTVDAIARTVKIHHKRAERDLGWLIKNRWVNYDAGAYTLRGPARMTHRVDEAVARKHGVIRATILSVIETYGWVSFDQLMDETGFSKTTTRDSLVRMEEAGLVRVKNRTRQPRHRFYGRAG